MRSAILPSKIIIFQRPGMAYIIVACLIQFYPKGGYVSLDHFKGLAAGSIHLLLFILFYFISGLLKWIVR